MRGDKQAIEQLYIGPTGLTSTWYATLDGNAFAQLNECPAGVAVRWLWLNWPEPHWNTIHEDWDAAIEYIREWVSGLDIIPWDEDARRRIADAQHD